jgi:predicted Zn-dependent protease
MRKNKRAILAALVSTISLTSIAFADDISPQINNRGKMYSKEAPDSSYFGIGPAGRLSEASYLRFQGQVDMDNENIEAAIAKIGKAVQLDPGDPEGHLLYAKALTAKFYANQGKVDEKLLGRCLQEWQLIWHHDADPQEQAEAKWQARKLQKIAKALDKEKKEKAKGANTLVAEGKADKDLQKQIEKDRQKSDMPEKDQTTSIDNTHLVGGP